MPLLPIHFHSMHLCVGPQLDRVIGCSIAILCHDPWRTSTHAHMAYNVVDNVLSVEFHIILCPFSIVAN